MATEKAMLPATEAYVEVSLLNGGSMIAQHHVMHAGEPPTKFRLYNWAFLIQHKEQNRQILWDMGMSSHRDDYSPIVAERYLGPNQVLGPFETLADQIHRRHGVEAEAIDTVIPSHAHFDHCRPVSREFRNAKVFFGPGTAEYCSPGHFGDPSSQWDGRFFDLKTATEKWETLAGPWVKFGAFDEAMDLFGDQSFWILKAPGHMPGNLSACARLKGGEWVMLGSDCCHSRALLDGTKRFGTFTLSDGSTFCLHTDVAAAEDTLSRMRIMEKDLGVHVALAHDAEWMLRENDSVLLQLLDERFKVDMRRALPLDEPF